MIDEDDDIYVRSWPVQISFRRSWVFHRCIYRI